MGSTSETRAGDRDTPVDTIGGDTSSVVIPSPSIEPETQRQPIMITVTKTRTEIQTVKFQFNTIHYS